MLSSQHRVTSPELEILKRRVWERLQAGCSEAHVHGCSTEEAGASHPGDRSSSLYTQGQEEITLGLLEIGQLSGTEMSSSLPLGMQRGVRR